MYNLVLILVEGRDDVKFFNEIIKPRFEKKSDDTHVLVREHAQEPNPVTDRILKNFHKMGADFIYVCDLNDKPCVTSKKMVVDNELKNVEQEKILIVVKKIECWYLAGLTKTNAKKLKIKLPTYSTDNITKDQFNSLVSKKFDYRIDAMAEILKYYSVKQAKKRNKSFKYLMKKYNIPDKK
ncbi:MAG: hypothetical protein ACOC1X_02130 [Promethearchaeota archaeon]